MLWLYTWAEVSRCYSSTPIWRSRGNKDAPWLLNRWGKNANRLRLILIFTLFKTIRFLHHLNVSREKLITIHINRLQFHRHAYNHLTLVQSGMLRDLNLSHLLWKIIPFVAMFYLVLKLFLKLCLNCFYFVVAKFSWQYQLHRLSDISSPKPSTSFWNNCVWYYLPLL